VLRAPGRCSSIADARSAFTSWLPKVPAWLASCFACAQLGAIEVVAQLLEQSPALRPFSGVRFSGYAAFNPAHADNAERVQARGLRLVGLYGISEIQALFSRQDENAPLGERAGAGGKPVSAVARVRARPRKRQDPCLRRARRARIRCVREPHGRLFRRLGRKGRALSQDGYHRSGDLGCTQPDGQFVFDSRMGDALRLGGFLVSPPEIGAVVQAFPGVSAWQVVGVPRAEGLRPVAFIVLEPEAALDETALLAHVRARLAPYKIPLRADALDRFSLTPGANATEIQKGKLRELAESPLRRCAAGARLTRARLPWRLGRARRGSSGRQTSASARGSSRA